MKAMHHQEHAVLACRVRTKCIRTMHDVVCSLYVVTLPHEQLHGALAGQKSAIDPSFVSPLLGSSGPTGQLLQCRSRV